MSVISALPAFLHSALSPHIGDWALGIHRPRSAPQQLITTTAKLPTQAADELKDACEDLHFPGSCVSDDSKFEFLAQAVLSVARAELPNEEILIHALEESIPRLFVSLRGGLVFQETKTVPAMCRAIVDVENALFDKEVHASELPISLQAAAFFENYCNQSLGRSELKWRKIGTHTPGLDWIQQAFVAIHQREKNWLGVLQHQIIAYALDQRLGPLPYSTRRLSSGQPENGDQRHTQRERALSRNAQLLKPQLSQRTVVRYAL